MRQRWHSAEDRKPRWRLSGVRVPSGFCAAIATFLAICVPALSQDEPGRQRDKLYEFHFPAASLETSIAHFTRQTNTSVLYEAGLINSRSAPAVDGMFSYPSALEALLAGTGIAVRYADDKSFVLVDAERDAETHATYGAVREASITLGALHVDGPEDFSFYGSLLAADLQMALSKRPRLRSVTLFVQANLWVDRAGRIEHAELSRSTGDRMHDERLVEALREFSVSKPPPEGLPQPVQVAIDFRHV